MNLEKVQGYITLYKKHFEYLDRKERYGWKAVKTFQDKWDPDASDFAEMLKLSLSDTVNLVQAKNEYAMTRILHFAQKSPQKTRRLFEDLYDESQPILQRIDSFRARVEDLNKQFPQNDGLHHQNSRAIGAYLALRYPGKYYFYKTRMIQAFFKEIEYPIRINQKKTSKFTIYYEACELLREILLKDKELIRMHLARLDESYFYDNTLHLLTQDVIYAIAEHFPKNLKVGLKGEIPSQEYVVNRWSEADVNQNLEKKKRKKPAFVGVRKDWEVEQKRNKQIGNHGELWVMGAERQRLMEAGMQRKAESVVHVAQTEGDGTGYDIRSYDPKTGKEIFIEVKTTTSGLKAPFYISRNELERSIQDSEKYRLYRVYDFDYKDQSASVEVFKGDLTRLCTEPSQFLVVVN